MNDGRNAKSPAPWAALAGLILAGLMAAGPALAQIGAPPPPSFPSALDRDTLLGWLRRETDILPERVVAVTPQALTAVVSTFPGNSAQGPRVVIRAEALSAETYARTGALSWHVSLSADCAGRRVKLGDTTGYPERNLLGERKILRAAEADWRTPEAGTALESALRSACDASFKGPFAGEAPAARPPAASPASPSPASLPPTSPTPTPARPPRPAKAASAVQPAPSPTPSPTSPPAAKPAPRAGISVQIGAYASPAEGQAALGKLPQDRPRSLEQAVVGGRTWYRLIVWGFADAQAAQTYCDQRKAAGGACFVRRPDRN